MACGVTYIMLALSWAVMMIVYGNDSNFITYFTPSVALTSVSGFASHWWTIVTYGWFLTPNSFMDLLSNMLWLYCFGSVVQMLIGPKHIAPMFIYCLLVGGVFYMLAQLVPGRLGEAPLVFMGPRAGIMGMAVAAVAISPNYRFYLSETFTIPLMLVAGVYVILMLLGSGFSFPVLMLLLSGAGMGFAYVKLLKLGYKPADWMFSLMYKIENTVTPKNERRYVKSQTYPVGNGFSKPAPQAKGSIQGRVDDLLDKINQKGYNALSKEEKEFLTRVGKEK
jgi:membrane associated rhomboid family serine protease